MRLSAEDNTAITSTRKIKPDFLPDFGEMGQAHSIFNWAETPVGPLEGWPESLKTAVRICIGSRHPMVLWWGKSDLTQFYNDAYISFLGTTKHPYWLGRSGRGCWSEIWHIMEPMLESVFRTGEATSGYDESNAATRFGAASPPICRSHIR
jgi:hypothetical protein